MVELLSRIFNPRTVELPENIKRHKGLKSRLDLSKPIGETEFVVFDTELTGLDFKRDSIISIGAIKMSGAKIKPAHTFYELVKPQCDLKHESVVIHEITHTDLEGADCLEHVLDDFIAFIGDAVLVGHFVFIDTNFVSRAMKQTFGITLQNPALDTLSLHEYLYEYDSRMARLYNGMTVKSDLFSMAKKYGITIEKAHNAFHDAYVTAQLFQRFLYFLPGCGISTLKELITVGKS